MMEEKSIFEKIRDGEVPANIVYEDEHCLCLHDIEPQAPVHVLLVPKRKILRIGASEASDQTLLGHLFVQIPKITEQLGIVEHGFRVVINNGENGGETVPHLHIHILGGRALEWPPG